MVVSSYSAFYIFIVCVSDTRAFIRSRERERERERERVEE